MDIIGKASESIHRRNADKAFEAENYESALKDYLKVVEIGLKHGEFADLASFYQKIGNCYLHMEFDLKDERVKNLVNAAEHLVKAAKMFREKGQWFESGASYETATKVYDELKDYHQAAEKRLLSAKMYSRSENDLITGLAYFHAAEYFEMIEEWENASKAFNEAAKMNVIIKDYSTASSSYKKAALNYRKVGKVEDAIDAYAIATELDFELGNYSEVAETYENMALCYEDMKNYNSALHYHLKAAEAFMDGKDYQATSAAYNNIGHCYELLNDQKNSLEYYMRAVRINSDKKDLTGLARSYENAAHSYERFGLHEEAAEAFLDAARTLITSDSKGSAAADFRRAAEVYMKLAKVKEKLDTDEAAEYYRRASECFKDLKDYKNAANIAFKGATLRLGGEEYDRGIRELREAADLYLKQHDPVSAAGCYLEAKDFLKAAETYGSFGEQKLKEGDFLGAADAYKMVAESYGKLKKYGPMREYYNNAIWQYTKYAKGKEQYELTNDVEVLEVADAYLKVGECNRLVGNDLNSKSNFQKSIEYYKKLDLKEKTDFARAFLLIVESKLSIKKGDYEGASEMLEESLKLIETSIPGATEENKRLLSQTKQDAEKLISEIGEKPDLDLILDRHSVTFKDSVLVLNGKIVDNGKNALFRINFLAHLPDELKVRSLPENIAQLNPGELRKVSLELTAETHGEYHIKPLEVFYEDSEGDKYVKASNEVFINVLEKPEVEFNTYRRAIETFNRYAESQLQNNNFFYSAEGFMQAAKSYGTFNDDEHLKTLYERAIETFKKFVEDLEGGDPLTLAENRRVAQAYQNIGICQASIDNLNPAKEYFEKAKLEYQRFIEALTDHQEKREYEKYVDLVEGYLLTVEGKIAISHGLYEQAEKLLDQAHESFEKAITKGGWEVDFEKGMEKEQEDVQRILEDVKSKPSFSADLPEQVDATEGATSVFRFKILNSGEDSLFDLSFLVHFPDDIDVNVPPDRISELKPEESKDVRFSYKPKKAGEYTFEPFNVTYKDKDGHKYLRGTPEITVAVLGGSSKKSEAGSDKSSSPEPGTLKTEFECPDKVAKNEEFTVRVKVTNTSKFRVLHEVIVDFTKAEDVVHTRPPVQKLEKILPGKKTDETFKLKPKKEGRIKIPVIVKWEDQQKEETLNVKVEV
ncbi:MAG: tetratricopeptide repeat protein [Candidatus Altiarchaeota archaeon]